MRMLALDTTTPVMGVALLEDGHLVSQISVRSRKSTSSRLFPIVDEALSLAGWDKGDVDVVALAVGPGSFTGVRVGVAAVKGMAYALGVKVVSVSTLEAMAYTVPVEGRLLFPLLDARRGQFYGAMFRWLKGSCERLTEDMLLSREDVERIAGSVLFVGDAASTLGYPSVPCQGIACEVGMVAFGKAVRGEFTPLGELRPVYLRPSDAEESKGVVVYKA